MNLQFCYGFASVLLCYIDHGITSLCAFFYMCIFTIKNFEKSSDKFILINRKMIKIINASNS